MMNLRKRNKLVYGVGVNDADYVTQPRDKNGKKRKCPFYRAWSNMLLRAYSPKYHALHPTYIGVTVCEQWHSFMAFRAWMQTQVWEGKQLDKDILHPGKKVYSPENCIFVTPQINTLLTDRAADRGAYPIGVSWNKGVKKYEAYLTINGKKKRIGYFTDPYEAHLAWRKAKYDYIRAHAKQQTDLRLSRALCVHADMILSGEHPILQKGKSHGEEVQGSGTVGAAKESASSSQASSAEPSKETWSQICMAV
jgi:hypothetical protein